MWPFKSNTQNELRVTNKTWLIEAIRLEDEAKRIEDLCREAYLRDRNPSLCKSDMTQWYMKASSLRQKALALRIYRGEEPKDEPKKEEEKCSNSFTCKDGGCRVNGTTGATATVHAMPLTAMPKELKEALVKAIQGTKKTTKKAKKNTKTR